MPMRSATQTAANAVASPTGGLNWGAGLSALGQGLQGYGSYMQSRAWSAANAASQKANEMLAIEAPKQADWEITRRRLAKRRALSSARFSFGYAGVQLEGTALDVLDEINREMTLDEMMVYREGQVAKARYEQEAKWAKKAAEASKKAGTMSMISSGIGAAASVLALSDVRVKENLRPIPDALKRVRQLVAYQYNFQGDDRQCIGLLAQEIEKVLLEAVVEIDGLKMVKLYEIQSLIVSAIRELCPV